MDNPLDDTSSKTPNSPNIIDRAFAKFGKIVVVLLVSLVLGSFGYYYYITHLNRPLAPAQNSITLSPTTTVTTQPTTSTTGLPAEKKQVSGGIQTEVFSKYSLMIPTDWVDNHSTDTATKVDKVTLTKGQYTLTISQAAGGAGSCLYPGDPTAPMAQVFDSFTTITGTSSQFRRGTSDKLTYTICEKKGEGFSFPTSFGYITYTTPNPSDNSVLGEMDSIVASLVKVS